MNEQQTDRIEAYLIHALSAEERTKFEQDMVNDPDLRREYALHTKAHAVINHGVHQRLKARLSEIDAELDAPQRVARITPAWRRWAVAASILILAAVATWIWADQSYDHATMADRMFAAVASEELRGDEVVMPVERHLQAQDLFAAGELEAARDAYLELVAVDNHLSPRAEWNLLMIYLALDQQPEFDALLEALVADLQHDFHQRAVKLRQTLQHPLYRLTH